MKSVIVRYSLRSTRNQQPNAQYAIGIADAAFCLLEEVERVVALLDSVAVDTVALWQNADAVAQYILLCTERQAEEGCPSARSRRISGPLARPTTWSSWP